MISQDKIILSIGILASILLYFSFSFVYTSIALFLIWLLSTSFFAAQILQRIFNIEKIYSRILGCFLSIFLLGFVLNIFTAWLKFSNLSIVSSLILTILILFIWNKIFKDELIKQEEGLPFKRILIYSIIILIICVVIISVFVFSVQTGEYIQSPWEILSSWYVLVILILSLLIYALIFSKKKTIFILIAIVGFSLILHSYLLVYNQGFGGDRWRHIGSEYRILQEIEYQPTLLTDNIWYSTRAGISVPRALIDAPKLSYGYGWSLSALTSKITHLDVFHIDKYLVLILWSLFLPFILFVAARQFSSDNRVGLLAAVMPSMFYVFQYYGSQTLPIGFGVIFFAFVATLWLTYLKNLDRKKLYFNIFLTALMYFGYSLGLVLAIMIGILALCFRLRGIFKYVGIVVLSVSIFILEFISSANSFQLQLSIKNILARVFTQNNFLYFSSGDWLPFSFSWSDRISQFLGLIFIILMIVFVYQVMRRGDRILKFTTWAWIIILINYLLSWHLLFGLHFTSRRLDVFIVILMALTFSWGIIYNFSKTKLRITIAVVFLAVLTTVAYISGPILNAMITDNQANVMEHVWSEINESPDDYCILANTWPLLALEGYSAKQVVAGNFPSDFNHQQPERVEIFDKVRKNPEKRDFEKALEVTGKNSCFLVLNLDIDYIIIEEIDNILGNHQIIFSHYIWKF